MNFSDKKTRKIHCKKHLYITILKNIYTLDVEFTLFNLQFQNNMSIFATVFLTDKIYNL